MTTQNPGFITVKDAAAILERSYDVARNLAHSGHFEHTRECRDNHDMLLLKASDVWAYKEARDAAAAKPKSREAEFPVKRESMGLHDWFAGQALAGLCANPEFMNRQTDFDRVTTVFELASKAYEIATGMTKGRDDVETPE